jgi:hypothetical protein
VGFKVSLHTAHAQVPSRNGNRRRGTVYHRAVKKEHQVRHRRFVYPVQFFIGNGDSLPPVPQHQPQRYQGNHKAQHAQNAAYNVHFCFFPVFRKMFGLPKGGFSIEKRKSISKAP